VQRYNKLSEISGRIMEMKLKNMLRQNKLMENVQKERFEDKGFKKRKQKNYEISRKKERSSLRNTLETSKR
jgi:hypothetical protein